MFIFSNKKLRVALFFLSIVAVSAYSFLYFFTSRIAAVAGTANIEFTNASDYAIEELKDTGSAPITYFSSCYCGYGNTIYGNLMTEAPGNGVNVDLTGSKIKVGNVIDIGGVEYRIIEIMDAVNGQIRVAGYPGAGMVNSITANLFSGGVVYQGSQAITAGYFDHGGRDDIKSVYDPSTDSIWVVSSIGSFSGEKIFKIDPQSGAILGSYNLSINPIDVTFDSTNNYLWILGEYSSGTPVVKFDPSTATVLNTYTIYTADNSTSPWGIAYDSTDDAVWFHLASFATSYLYKIHASDGSGFVAGDEFAISPISISHASGSSVVPMKSLAYDSVNHAIWVIEVGTKYLSKVDAATGTVLNSHDNGTYGNSVIIDPDHGYVFATHGGLRKYDAATGNFITTINTLASNYALAYDSVSDSLWVSTNGSTVKQINPTNNTVVYTHNYSANTTDSIHNLTFDNVNNALWGNFYDMNSNIIKIIGASPSVFSTTITTNTTQADSSSWVEFSSVSITSSTDANQYYSFSFDGRQSFKIWNGTAWRTIASSKSADHGSTEGVWHYQNGSNSWIAAEVNSANSAVSQAVENSSNNQLGKSTLTSLTDVELMSSSGTGGWSDAVSTVDVAVTMTASSVVGASFQSSYVDNITLGFESLPAIEFNLTSASNPESTTSYNIEVSLSGAHSEDVTVQYAVTGGTATSGGVDYTLANGTLEILAGLTSGNIPITIIDDSLDESSEVIEITLSNPTNATLGTNTVFTYTITDDDSSYLIITNSLYAEISSLNIGDDIYFQVNDADKNTDSGVAESFSVDVSGVTSGDTETITVTETGANTSIFRGGPLSTSTDAGSSSDGTLNLETSDTVNASVSSTSINSIDDFESYIDTAGLTSSWNAVMGDPISLEPTGTQTGGNDYLKMAIQSSNTNGGIVLPTGLSAIDFGSGSLLFKITTSNNSVISYSTTFGTPTTFNGFSILVMNQLGEAGIATVTNQLGACLISGSTYCQVPQSAFTQQFDQGGGAMPLITNWSNVEEIYFIFATSDGNTGNAVDINLDSISYGGTSSYSDTVSATGSTGLPPVTEDVDVSAIVEPLINLTLSSYYCNLGTLSTSLVKTCSFDVTASTNATQGYTVYIKDTNNGTLSGSTGVITAAVGTSINAGAAGFGLSTSQAGQGLVQNTSCVDGSVVNAQAVSTSDMSVASASQPVAEDTVTVCVAAAISNTTPAGSYSNNVVITIIGNF